jgi:hypothetical protein|tara:strand:+ start:743 stop:847 length:105 start_codon:yes stop_codon:yes gene_type:complete
MENAIGFIIFAAVVAFAFRKQLAPFYNKYFGDKK